MIKRLALVTLAIVCLSLPAFAAADVPAGDVFGGFSIAHNSNAPSVTLYGWDGSAAVNVHPMLGVVGDVSGYYKTISGTKVKVYTYLFGPRVNFRKDKMTYFGEALFGGDRESAGGVSTNEFAMGFGGGVDIQASKKINVRLIEFDWVPTKASGGGGWDKKTTRYSFGVDFPFGMRK